MNYDPERRHQFLMRVMQGVMLGAVLLIPVGLWGYVKVRNFKPQQDEMLAVPMTTVQPGKAPSKVNPTTVAKRKTMRDGYGTAPASQMNVRIDDGSRGGAPSATQDVGQQ